VRGPQQDIDIGGVEERSDAATANGFDDDFSDLSSGGAAVIEPGEVAVKELAHP
jgi:hypothetical protein